MIEHGRHAPRGLRPRGRADRLAEESPRLRQGFSESHEARDQFRTFRSGAERHELLAEVIQIRAKGRSRHEIEFAHLGQFADDLHQPVRAYVVARCATFIDPAQALRGDLISRILEQHRDLVDHHEGRDLVREISVELVNRALELGPIVHGPSLYSGGGKGCQRLRGVV